MPRDSEVSDTCRVPQLQSTPSSSQGLEEKAERDHGENFVLVTLI